MNDHFVATRVLESHININGQIIVVVANCPANIHCVVDPRRDPKWICRCARCYYCLVVVHYDDITEHVSEELTHVKDELIEKQTIKIKAALEVDCRLGCNH